MEPRPRPITGAVLGLLLGLVAVGLVWQLGWLPPDRLVVFGVPALTAFGAAWLLTREARAALGRFVGVSVVCGALAGAALTGIPELVRGGSTSEGCTLEVTANGRVATPDETSAVRRLVVTADEPASWTATTAASFSPTEAVAGLVIGGYQVDLHTVTYSGEAEGTSRTGTVDVAAGLAEIQDRTSLELTGVYHLAGRIAGDTGRCAFDGYAALMPAGVFATNVLVGLWIALGVLLLLLAWAAFAVRRSFRDAARAEAEREPEPEDWGPRPGATEADDGAAPVVPAAIAAGATGAAATTAAEEFRPPVSPYDAPTEPVEAAPDAAPAEQAPPVERRSFAAPAAAGAAAAGAAAGHDDTDDEVDREPADEAQLPDDSAAEAEVDSEPEPEDVTDEPTDDAGDDATDDATDDAGDAGDDATDDATDDAGDAGDDATDDAGVPVAAAEEPSAEPGEQPVEEEADDATVEMQRVRAALDTDAEPAADDAGEPKGE